ncbi:MAG: hypothetical protein PV358_19890, partial [Acidimicrobiales bacterium]|nr:hypothetical protein [Acidimicrobiales bacterium]
VDGMLHVTATGAEPFAEGSEASARVTNPDLAAADVRLERVAGDTFAGAVPVGDAGTYAVAATVADPSGGQVASGTALTNVSYGAEYEPGEPDTALLARVSEATGGRGEIEATAAFDPDDLQAGRLRVPLAGWLLLAAALAWPLAVALSRLALAGTAGRSIGRLGSTSMAWLRARAPGLPGRPAGSSRPPPGDPSPEEGRGDSSRARSREREPVPAAAPAESLGALLASQRRRRGVTSDDADGSGDDGDDS